VKVIGLAEQLVKLRGGTGEVPLERGRGLAARTMVDVAHRRGEVPVADPLLDVVDVRAGSDGLGAECVPQVPVMPTSA